MSQMRSQVLSALCGAVAVAIAITGFWYYAPGPWRDEGPSAIDLALQRRQDLQERYAAAQPRVQPIAPVVVATPVQSRGCTFSPVLRRSAADDGQFSASATGEMRALPDADAFVSVARDAAAHGRSRDAEAAFVVACRVQSQQAPGSESLADIESALARHYVNVAQEETSPQLRAQALGRARDLFAEAARIYGSTLGAQAVKTRDSQQGLREVAGAVDPAVQVDEASAAQVEARASITPPVERPRIAAPKADTQPDVANDAELAQLESDLQRLRHQAEAVSDDPDGLRARSAQALAQRQRCHDSACLRRWYAARRQALLGEF